ncbi:hypothetical protein SB912_28650, partial [Pantoea sp. SIMBA_072]
MTKANSTDQQVAGKQTNEPSKKSAKSSSVEQPVAIVPPIDKELLEPAEQACDDAGLPNTPVKEVFTHLPEVGQPAGDPLKPTPSV